MEGTGDMNQSNTRRGPRTTAPGLLVHGFFIMLPLLMTGFVAVQVFLLFQKVVKPLVNVLPGTMFRKPFGRFLAVCVVATGLMILLGLLAHTRRGKAIGRWLESAVLNRVPFYVMLRNLASGLAGAVDAQSFKPVRVTVDVPGLDQLGFIVERHQDGSATVFLPSAPNPTSGTVVVVERSRIRELSVPVSAVFGCMGRWGEGTASLLEKAERAGTRAASPPQAGATNEPIKQGHL
jgi:uncharacterized membrane protein